jgi:TolB protein
MIMKFFQSRRLVIACCLAIFVTFLGAIRANAELRIDITQGRVEPMPIAVTDFSGKADREAQIGADISQVISANLERSGLFKPLDRLAFIQAQPPMDVTPRFADWRVLNAQAMAHGVIDVLPDGRIQVDFRLWDVFSGQQMEAQRLTAAADGWKTAILIRVSFISLKPGRRTGGSNVWPSWIRTGPVISF